LLRWHREQLKALIPPMLEKWQPILGVQVVDCGIKKMKTKWGSCNTASRRVWFNLKNAVEATQVEHKPYGQWISKVSKTPPNR
jgi:hypothetical protein